MAGIHVIKNDFDIILEAFDKELNNTSEIDFLIHELIIAVKRNEFKRVLFVCPETLLHKLNETKKKMKSTGEIVIFTRNLSIQLNTPVPPYEIWSSNQPESISFLAEVMGSSPAKVEKFLMGMKSELPSQVDKMYTVYKVENDPVGVVFPHIEPDTDQEGRLFWIGIHPSYLGKGYGKALHTIGLHRLQMDFKAKSYLGTTNIDNSPMKSIMKSNGCHQRDSSVISLEHIL